MRTYKVTDSCIDASMAGERKVRFGQRHVICAVLFILATGLGTIKYCLPVAIVSMVVAAEPNSDNKSLRSFVEISENNQTDELNSNDNSCPKPNVTVERALELLELRKQAANVTKAKAEFNWTTKTQGIILGGFNWGVMISEIPAGVIAQHYGGKRVLVVITLIAIVTAAFTPISARWGPIYLTVVRAIGGVGIGGLFSASHVILTKWVPVSERSKLIGIVHFSSTISTVIAFPSTAFISNSPVGWPAVFYVFGGFAALGFILLLVFVYETPGQDPWISDEEKIYLEVELQQPAAAGDVTASHKPSQSINNGDLALQDVSTTVSSDNHQTKTPWLAIVKSKEIWALILAILATRWTGYGIANMMPQYQTHVLYFDLTAVGLLATLAPVCAVIGSALSIAVAGVLESRNVTTTRIRKLFTAITLILPAISFSLVPLVGCSQIGVMAILCIGFTAYGAMVVSLELNPIDLAPNFSGAVTGVSMFLGDACGIVVPLVMGSMVSDFKNTAQWYTIFYINAGINMVAVGIYLIWGSAERLSWNDQT